MKQSILLSIKPEYVNEIRDGNKRFEFRRSIPRNLDLSKVWVYESAPVSKIVGYFKFAGIISTDFESLWDICQDGAGIKKDLLQSYYSDKKECHAYLIREFVELDKPILIQDLGFKSPPQNFMYIKDELIEK